MLCLEGFTNIVSHAVNVMVVEPPPGLTDSPGKPLAGAAIRKEVVLNEQEKAESNPSGKKQRAERK